MQTERNTKMTIERLMEFARAYAQLGWAVQQQVNDVVNGEYGDLNPNALAEMERTLKGYHEDLDAAIVDAHEATVE